MGNKTNYNFDVERTTKELINWIEAWFDENGKNCNAIIGISGGKDSTIAAALCVEALGRNRVIGVLMPNGNQKDIKDAKEICLYLGIKNYEINIGDTVNCLENTIACSSNGNFTISEQTQINLAPRIRMTTLYAVAQSNNGRVVNTCNLSENYCGFSTLYGDHAGDMSLFDSLTVTEIKQIGHFLKLPDYLVDKTPSDGLSGKTDEDIYGFSYAALDKFIRTGICENEVIKEKILVRNKANKFKMDLINFPHYVSNYPKVVYINGIASYIFS